MPLHFFQIIPNINTLGDFGAQDPSAISGLTSPTKPVTERVVSSSPFSLSVLVLIVVSYYIIYIFLVLIVVSYYIIFLFLFLFSFLFQTFKVFLNHYVDRSTIFETSLSNDEVIGFSTAGKKLFQNLADILITFSEKGNYAGDFMGRIRMYEDWNVSYPYPAQVSETTSTTSLSDGLRADVKHFRRMVALIIKKIPYRVPYTIIHDL